MKTAFDRPCVRHALWTAALVVSMSVGLGGTASSAWAAGPAAPQLPSVPGVSAPLPSAMVETSPVPSMPVTSLPGPMNTQGGSKDSRNLSALESKLTDSVKDTVKRLGDTTDQVTLDDLNTARQAIAKIEALIDIEKRLTELSKIREEREGKASSLASAIPSSALMPSMAPSWPPQMPKPLNTVSDDAKGSSSSSPMPSSTGSVNIDRIVGSNGSYAAVIKGAAEGDEKTVRVGDRLPDGSTVVKITPMSVETRVKAKERVIRVKGVDTVFGAVP